MDRLVPHCESRDLFSVVLLLTAGERRFQVLRSPLAKRCLLWQRRVWKVIESVSLTRPFLITATDAV